MFKWLIANVWEKRNPEANGFDALRLFLICGLILGVPIGVALIYFSFASRPVGPTKPPREAEAANPLEGARQMLSRETDLETCRSAVSQLNAFLAKNEKRRPPSLTEAERSDLEKRFDLDRGELLELDSENFTQLDSHYLDLCFLLRDAAAALDVEIPGVEEGKRRETPLRQAEAAFTWVVRQVRQEKSDAAPLPPQFVLRRGWGSPLERALVFIEMLRHVGTADERLTGCLVYCPDKSGDMRLWACGVIVGDKTDVYLFDPRLGLPIPGPKGEGIATLAAASTDKFVLGQLTVSEAHPYDVTTDQAAKAQVRYVCSLSGLAPRMKLLQDDLLPPAVKIRLVVDQTADWTRLEKAVKAQLGSSSSLAVWRDGRATGPGVLRRFLPPEDGGVDSERPGRRYSFIWGRGDKFGINRGVVPVGDMHRLFRDQNRFPVGSGLGTRVWSVFAQPFVQAALEPHHSRDEMLRGRYSKAAPELSSIRNDCRNAFNVLVQKSASAEFNNELEDWIKRAIEAYAELSRAGNDPARLEAANQRVGALWDNASAVLIALLGTRAEPLGGETAYQLALCKHEQAERVQQALALNPTDPELKQRAIDAWKESANLWQQCLDDYGRRFAGNTAGSAARLLGQSLLLSGDRDGALRTWRMEFPTVELERVGTLYLVKKDQR